jgi:Phytanoyl-CoA dioxygenase (PhyH)
MLRNRSLYRRYGIRRSVFRTLAQRHVPDGACEESELPWLDRPGAAEALAADSRLGSFPEPIRESLRHWSERGYAVLDGFFEPALIDRINGEIEAQLERGRIGFNRGSERVRNVYKRCPAAAEAVGDPRMLELLSFLLGREVGIWQSISFFRGSRQGAHSDAFHMTTEPPGYLIAIWIALEDIEPGCGPVFYLPGTHRLKQIVTEDLELDHESPFFVPDKAAAYYDRIKRQVRESGVEPVRFLPRKGDVLVWHSNLLHGGGPITEPDSTRRSLVAHYYGKGSLRWHEIAEHPSLV